MSNGVYNITTHSTSIGRKSIINNTGDEDAVAGSDRPVNSASTTTTKPIDDDIDLVDVDYVFNYDGHDNYGGHSADGVDGHTAEHNVLQHEQIDQKMPILTTTPRPDVDQNHEEIYDDESQNSEQYSKCKSSTNPVLN